MGDSDACTQVSSGVLECAGLSGVNGVCCLESNGVNGMCCLESNGVMECADAGRVWCQ
jgi:hypothetical protein